MGATEQDVSYSPRRTAGGAVAILIGADLEADAYVLVAEIRRQVTYAGRCRTACSDR